MARVDAESLISGADLSDKANFIANRDTDGKVGLAAAATESIAGVILDGGTASGDACSIAYSGVVWVEAGGNISEEAWLTTDSAGKAISTTTDGDVTIGRAMDTGVAGDQVRVNLQIQHLFIA